MKIPRVLAVLGLLTALVAPVAAQDLGVRAFGLRGGINLNPDQLNLGVHVDAGKLTSKVRFQPSLELGLGNGVRLLATNFDALYLFAPKRWRPYAGGGLGINFIDVTNGVGQDGGLDLEPVLNLVGGVEWGAHRSTRKYLLEARVGVGDTPDLKLTAGVTF